jgi:hypothetical protein
MIATNPACPRCEYPTAASQPRCSECGFDLAPKNTRRYRQFILIRVLAATISFGAASQLCAAIPAWFEQLEAFGQPATSAGMRRTLAWEGLGYLLAAAGVWCALRLWPGCRHRTASRMGLAGMCALVAFPIGAVTTWLVIASLRSHNL